MKSINYFGMIQHVGITFKIGFSFKEDLKPHMGYFRVTLNAIITYRVGFSFKSFKPSYGLL
jgi:hypothetical protein